MTRREALHLLTGVGLGVALDAAGELTFPNAPYYVPAAEWAFWFSDAAAARTPACMVDGEGAFVFGHHLPPFPGLGRVAREGGGWRWRPAAG